MKTLPMLILADAHPLPADGSLPSPAPCPATAAGARSPPRRPAAAGARSRPHPKARRPWVAVAQRLAGSVMTGAGGLGERRPGGIRGKEGWEQMMERGEQVFFAPTTQYKTAR